MKIWKAIWIVLLSVWVASVGLFAQKAPGKVLAEDGQYHGLGLIYKDPATISSWHRLDTKGLAEQAPALPSSVINTTYLPPVGNQGSQGSCVAWATAYYTKTYMEAKEHGWDPVQLAHQFSPAYMYNQGRVNTDGGMVFSDATEILTHLGCATLDQMPYDQSDYTTLPSENAYKEAMSYRIGQTTYVDMTQAGALTALKQWLNKGNVAFAGIFVYQNFYNISSYNYNYCLADATSSGNGAHATTIIGYDDAHVTDDGTGAFRCVNSWGTGWGDQGYYWLSYQAVTDPNHKIFVGFVAYWQELVGDSPTVAAKFQVAYSEFRDLRVTLTAGQQEIALWNLASWRSASSRNLALSAPGHPIWVDLSDLTGPVYALSVTDGSNEAVSGTLTSFSVVQLAGNVETPSPDPPLTISPPDTPVPITNGGFQSGLLDWNPSVWQGGSAPVVTTTTVHSGSSAALLGAGGTTAGQSFIAHALSLPAGGASLLAWCYPQQQNPGSHDYQGIAVSGGTDFYFSNNAQSWTPVYLDLTPYVGQNTWVYFWTYHDGSTSGSTSMVVDDVSLCKQHPAVASVTVKAQPLAATAQAQPTSGMAPLNVTFTGSATGGVPPYTFTWNLGDGGATVIAQDLTHKYLAAGSYGVILTVRDASGTTAQDKHFSIQVQAVTPLSVSASADKISGTVPLTVTFSATAAGGTAPYSYMWSFGDGHTESSETASDTFTQPGSYTATVTVTDAAGGQASDSVTITVSPQPPVITGVQKLTNPLRLKIYGTNFHLACTVKINEAVAMSSWKNGSLLVAKKGESLKALLPKGVPVQITITNTDDGGVSAPFGYMR